MDHLPKPKLQEPLNLVVPYLCEEAPSYDGIGLIDFPQRMGYESTFLDDQPPRPLAAFLQSWLYFGALQDTLAVFCEDQGMPINPQDLVKMPEDGISPKVIRSEALLMFIKQYTVAWSKRSSLSRKATEMFRIRRVHRNIRDLYDSRLDQLQRRDSETLTSVIISIRLLWEAVTPIPPLEHCYDGFAVAAAINPSGLAADYVRQILRRRSSWCEHQIIKTCRKSSLTTLLYIASLRRQTPEWINHDQCSRQPICVAYNMNSSTWPQPHLSEGCTCAKVEPPLNEMLSLLRQGEIPVLRYQQGISGQPLISYVKAVPGGPYTAISHLWADGLNDRHGSPLFQCQLARLAAQVSHMRSQPTSYPNKLPWKTYDRGLPRIPFPSSIKGPIDFWLDIYCVPQRAYTATLSIREKCGRDTLFGTAMKLMAASYSWADSVLILDHELSLVDKDQDTLEFYARVAVSGCNARHWTFQEQSLAQKLAFQGRDKAWLVNSFSVMGLELALHYHPLHNLFTDDLGPMAVRMPSSIDLEQRSVARGEADIHCPEERRFVVIWNMLSRRGVTEWEDALHIMATLLRKHITDGFLKSTPINQMKALIATQNKLPVQFLTASMKRYGHKRETRTANLHDNHPDQCEPLRILEDAWVPLSPLNASSLADGCDYDRMTARITSEGLLIDSTIMIQEAAFLRNWKGLVAACGGIRTSPLDFLLEPPPTIDPYSFVSSWIDRTSYSGEEIKAFGLMSTNWQGMAILQCTLTDQDSALSILYDSQGVNDLIPETFSILPDDVRDSTLALQLSRDQEAERGNEVLEVLLLIDLGLVGSRNGRGACLIVDKEHPDTTDRKVVARFGYSFTWQPSDISAMSDQEAWVAAATTAARFRILRHDILIPLSRDECKSIPEGYQGC